MDYLNKKYIRTSEQQELKVIIRDVLDKLLAEKPDLQLVYGFNSIVENAVWNKLKQNGVLNCFPSNLYDIIRDVMFEDKR